MRVLLIFSTYCSQTLIIMSDRSTLLLSASCAKHILKVFVISRDLFIHESELKRDYVCYKLSISKWYLSKPCIVEPGLYKLQPTVMRILFKLYRPLYVPILRFVWRRLERPKDMKTLGRKLQWYSWGRQALMPVSLYPYYSILSLFLLFSRQSFHQKSANSEWFYERKSRHTFLSGQWSP